MPSYTSLNGISLIGDTSFNDQLVTNVVEFFSWGLLGAGNFFTVSRPGSSGAYGGSQYRMRLAEDPNYTKGRVWETFRSNWVWESGVGAPVQPTPISGVYVNGTFYGPATTGSFSYSLNYPLGRVTFNNPVAASSAVELNYSFKFINVYEAVSPWFKEIQFNSFRLDDEHFRQYGSGIWSTMAQNRIQLPAFVVEAVPQRTWMGKQMGGGSYMYQDLRFHLYAESPEDRDRMIDIISFQKEKTLILFDKDKVVQAQLWPLNYYGSIAPSALCYPDILSREALQLNRNHCRFMEVSCYEMESMAPGLYQAVVRATMEIDCPDI